MKFKRLIFCAFITSALIFSGCSSKAANTTKNSINSSTAAFANQAENNSSASAAASTSATGNLKPIKPNTVPQLSTDQKKKIDSKMNSTLKNIDNTLKSIQDPSDINLDSTN